MPASSAVDLPTGEPPSVSDLQAEFVEMQAPIDLCRRIMLDEHRILTSVIHMATTRDAHIMQQLKAMRGHTLIQVNDKPINEHQPLGVVLDDITFKEAGGEDTGLTLDLTFHKPMWPPHRVEENRQKSNGLYEPASIETALTTEVLLRHLQPKGFRKNKLIRDLSQIPSGICFYFNHPNWRLAAPGALLKLPPRSLKELDL